MISGAAAQLAALLVATSLAGCDREPPLTSCGDSLAGVWRAGDGRRFHVVDTGLAVQVFPMFDDSRVGPELGVTGVEEVAPAVVDLQRSSTAATSLTGTIVRRYVHRGAICNARGPATITACRDRSARLWYAPAKAPDDWATVTELPCMTSTAPPVTLQLARD